MADTPTPAAMPPASTPPAEKSSDKPDNLSTADPAVKAEAQATQGAKLDHAPDAGKKDEDAPKPGNANDLPAQMTYDDVDPIEGRGFQLNGRDPHLHGEDGPTGGTLPPV